MIMRLSLGELSANEERYEEHSHYCKNERVFLFDFPIRKLLDGVNERVNYAR